MIRHLMVNKNDHIFWGLQMHNRKVLISDTYSSSSYPSTSCSKLSSDSNTQVLKDINLVKGAGKPSHQKSLKDFLEHSTSTSQLSKDEEPSHLEISDNNSTSNSK